MNYEYYRLSKHKMRQRAKAFGIASLVCAIVFITWPFLSVILAGFAILFASLSRGSDTEFHSDAKIALGTSIIALCISFFVLGSVYMALKTNDEYRHNVEETMDTLYGSMYGDVNGETFGESMERFFSGRSD